MISHFRQMHLSLAMNVFNAGDEDFWHWRQMHFVLGMNNLMLEMNALKRTIKLRIQPHTHLHVAIS